MIHSISFTISSLKLTYYEMSLVQDDLHLICLNRHLIYPIIPKAALGPREFIEFIQHDTPLSAPHYISQTYEIIQLVTI